MSDLRHGVLAINENGLFFSVVPSEGRHGEALANAAIKNGITRIAVAHVDDETGKGLARDFAKAFDTLGGTLCGILAFEGMDTGHAAGISELAVASADHLLIIGSADQGGRRIIREAVSIGAFSGFLLSDGMIGDALMVHLGSVLAEH